MSLNKEFNKYYISEGCYINKVDNGIPEPEHTHSFLEIVYIFSGRGVHMIDGDEYPVGAGDALFINYGSTHSFQVLDKMGYADILIKPEFISESLKGVENAFALLQLDNFKDFDKTVDRDNRIMHFSAAERKQIETLILLAHGEQEGQRPGKELALRSLFNTLLIFIFRKMALPMKQEIGIGNELLHYIKTHCAQTLTMEGIAEANHYNAAYFSRLFKRQTGYTFTEYLTACRVDLACDLLQGTKLKVDEVAARAGFSDRTKFYKVFAQRVGMTPYKYRKSKK